MEDIFCKLISECGKEKLFLILLLIISLLKYVINKLIFNTFPKIELEQNDYESEVEINKEAIKYLNAKKDFKCMVIILEILFFINVIIYKILFNNFLYFYSIVIGFFLLIMCVVIGIYNCCEKSKKNIKAVYFKFQKTFYHY